jgi:general secretion pathway protein I
MVARLRKLQAKSRQWQVLGFSLLEVMVAISILGLALTVILSAQGGLSASNHSAKNMGTAATLGRCKMTEMEEKILKYGYPLVDSIETETACCDDDKDPNFSCDIRVERIVMPNLPNMDGGTLEGGTVATLALSDDGGIIDTAAATGSAKPNPFADPASAAAASAFTGFSSAIDIEGGLSGVGGQIGSTVQAMGGQNGMLTTVMGIVYPGVKFMMEAAIRKLSVTVRWKEGKQEKTFLLTQYITNPAQVGIEGGDGGLAAVTGSSSAAATSVASALGTSH